MKNKYRIVETGYRFNPYRVQVKKWYWPFWEHATFPGASWSYAEFSTIEECKKFIKKQGIVYVEGKNENM